MMLYLAVCFILAAAVGAVHAGWRARHQLILTYRVWQCDTRGHPLIKPWTRQVVTLRCWRCRRMIWLPSFDNWHYPLAMALMELEASTWPHNDAVRPRSLPGITEFVGKTP